MENPNVKVEEQTNVVSNSKVVNVTENDKNAVFDIAGSTWGLIMAIIVSIQGSTVLLNFKGVLSWLVNAGMAALAVVGMWMIWSTSKKRILNNTGVKLIQISVIVDFVLKMLLYFLVFIGVLILLVGSVFADASADTGALFRVIGIVALFASIVMLLVDIFYFKSVNGLLKNGKAILGGEKTRGKKSGNFAAIMIIVKGALALAASFGSLSLVGSGLLQELLESVPEDIAVYINTFLATGILMGIFKSVFSFGIDIYGALLILKFNGKLEK